jgi:hypothetical protein
MLIYTDGEFGPRKPNVGERQTLNLYAIYATN